MKVFIAGKGLMLNNLILGAIESGAEVVGVLRYEKTCTTKYILMLKDLFMPNPQVTLIKKFRLFEPNIKSLNSKEFRKLLLRLNVDLLVVGTWKEKISSQIYKIPTIASINVHPSLLPKYRGPNPYMQTILHGEKYSGVTFHLINDKIDSGEILCQERIPLFINDTSKELRERTVVVARKMMKNLCLDLNTKILAPIKQDERYATYYPHISGEERMLDFVNQTSDEISRTVRALHPFLPTYITVGEDFFIVNPYKFGIINTVGSNSGDIISKSKSNSSLTLVCKDKKAIKFDDLKLYKLGILRRLYQTFLNFMSVK